MHESAHVEVAVGDVVEATFEKIIAGGDALAYIGRRVLFVPFAAAGDRARVEVVSATRGLLRGRIVELLEPSPERRTPRCAHFGQCGGCRLQHIVPSAARSAKAGIVREALRRIGGIDWPGTIVVRAADEYGWRSRAEVHISAPPERVSASSQSERVSASSQSERGSASSQPGRLSASIPIRTSPRADATPPTLESARNGASAHPAERAHDDRSPCADGESRSVGYLREGTHAVCAVRECPVLKPELARALEDLRVHSLSIPRDARSAILAAGDDGTVALSFRDARGAALAPAATGSAAAPPPPSSPDHVARPGSRIRQRIAGFDFTFSAAGFFQGNRALVAGLVDAATAEAPGHAPAAQPIGVGAVQGERTLAFDLYAGAGLFTLPLCRRVARVISVESEAESVLLARENARTNRITNAEIVRADVVRWLAHRERSAARPDLVLLDPPRSGAGPAVMEALLALEPAEIRYVSCDPATLARDLRGLIGHYDIASVIALDLFPQTAHVEVVVRLVRAR